MARKNFFSSKRLYSNYFQSKTMSGPMMFLSIILILLSSSFSTSRASSDQNTTKLSAYQVLQQYNFPVGLLPKGVLSYELDRETGKFEASLNGSCKFTIEGYNLKYKSTISGVISTNRIKNLKGISVKILLFWINIVEVSRDGDELQFSVGIASANFPVDNFVESPQCGCGFDCDALAEGARSSSLVTSY